MSNRHTFFARPVRSSMGGFTLVELMVGVVIGLLSVVVIASVLVYSENQKRSTTSGSDAQVNGALGLYAIQRQVQMAGYGLGAEPSALGCAITATFGAAAVADFPTVVAPLIITQGVNGAPDTIRVLASTKTNYAVPVRVIPPGYDPTDAVGDKAVRFPVSSTLGFVTGDLVLVAPPAGVAPQNCGVFQVTSAPINGGIPRANAAAAWNNNGQPSTAYGDGSFLINLGSLLDLTYSITASNKLNVRRFDTSTLSSSNQEVQSNIVNLQALYGKDTDADGVVDTYDATTPADAAGWAQVLTVRVALVARSAQYEKDDVTSALPLWDVGTATTVAGSADCGTSKCITLNVGGDNDWKRYRYKIFDTVIPLRNRLWTSNAP